MTAMNLFDLSGSKAIVTGGSRGLGRGMAEGLHEAGAEVALIDISDDLEKAAIEIGSTGPAIHAIKGNLLDRNDLTRGFQEALGKLGGTVDILINNAGMHVRRPCIGFPTDAWDNVIELNLTAAFLMSQLAGEVMLKRGRGKIINTASLLSFIGGFNATAYAASKGGIAQLTKSLANEWAGGGINVNAIAPGYMDTQLNADLINDDSRTPMINARIPAGRWGTPNDLKGVIIFLASAASDYVNGVIIPIDGGYLVR